MQVGEAAFHAALLTPATSVAPQGSLKPVLTNLTDPRPLPVVGIEPSVDPSAAFGRVEYTDGRAQSVVADRQWVKLVADPPSSKPDSDQAKGDGMANHSGQGKGAETLPMASGEGAIGLPVPRSGLTQDSD
jgi:hypothetical protein